MKGLEKEANFKKEPKVRDAFRAILLDVISEWEGDNKNRLINELDSKIIMCDLGDTKHSIYSWFFDTIAKQIREQASDETGNPVKNFIE